MIIYKTTNIINEKIYIGQDAKHNPKYLGSGKILRLAIKKYGKENFKKDILEIVDDITKAAERETYWIEFFDARNHEIGYNILSGGTSWIGMHHTEETKNKISETRKNNKSAVGEKNPMHGKKHTDESKQKMSKSSKGKTHSEESKQKRKGKKLTNEHKDNISSGLKNSQKYKDAVASQEFKDKISKLKKGTKLSQETKDKISKANKGKLVGDKNPFYGKTHSQETKQKLSKINKGKKITNEHKKNISDGLKRKKELKSQIEPMLEHNKNRYNEIIKSFKYYNDSIEEIAKYNKIEKTQVKLILEKYGNIDFSYVIKIVKKLIYEIRYTDLLDWNE